MKCEEVEAKMIDYLDNKLDEDIRREIEKHLETCQRCLDDIMESQKVMNLISKDEMEKPDDSLRINFYHLLHSEIEKNKSANRVFTREESLPWHSKTLYRVAAGVALLICGTFIGMYLHTGVVKSKDIAELQQLHYEVNALKKTAITMLNEESSSNRIQAVNYADDLENPDAPVIEVLVKTLNYDKNVNVRMAAAYALARFADQQQVCDSLVESLSKQVDPILQVTLINILVERKERSALKPIQQIITNEKTLREVRAVAENGAKRLI